ncbi:MAG: tetratricopeptide repeat protein [Spirochaetales bacterium]|nr:tetratricopeptide repeat protein [Spirochaetales bacterium]
MKTRFVAFCLTLVFSVGFAAEKIKNEVEVLEEKLNFFSESVLAQVDSLTRQKEIYREINSLLSSSLSIGFVEKNYFMVQNEFLMGKAYQLFDNEEVAIDHNRKLRKGAIVSLAKLHSNIDLIFQHYQESLNYIELALSEGEDDNVLTLYSAVLGNFCTFNDLGFLFKNGRDVVKALERAIEINGSNAKALILFAASKSYPPKLYGGKPRLAIEMMNNLLTSNNCSLDRIDYFDIYTVLGHSYAKEGDYESAELYLRKALEIFPKNVHVNGLMRMVLERDF